MLSNGIEIDSCSPSSSGRCDLFFPHPNGRLVVNGGAPGASDATVVLVSDDVSGDETMTIRAQTSRVE